jgi:hypothetical protein
MGCREIGRNRMPFDMRLWETVKKQERGCFRGAANQSKKLVSIHFKPLLVETRE